MSSPQKNGTKSTSSTPARESTTIDQPATPTPAASPFPSTLPSGTDEQVQAAMSNLSATSIRQDIAENFRQGNGFVNPDFIPLVPGVWRWLESVDEDLAHTMGYGTPVEVTAAREARTLTDTVDTRSPAVVFIPDQRFFNPSTRPPGDGYWAYMSPYAEQLAHTNFGGQEEYGTENAHRPTASRIWRIRERIIADSGRFGETENIDLVWIPNGGATEERSASPTPSAAFPSTSPDPELGPTNIDTAIFDEDPPYHRHDLTNGGENDQSGVEDLRRYRTILIGGKKYTCDVSAAAVNRPEPHKFWIANKKGVWRRWEHADTMDWTKKKSVEDLNGWRDQSLSRARWPAKRKEKREDYEEDEKRWVFGFVAKNNGRPPGGKELKNIAAEFNKRFSAQRTQAALSSLCARLGYMYKGNNGHFVVGPKRGDAKKEEAKRNKRKREEDGEEEPRKRGGSSKKKDEKEEVSVPAVGSGDEDAGIESEEDEELGPGDADAEGERDADVRMQEDRGDDDGKEDAEGKET